MPLICLHCENQAILVGHISKFIMKSLGKFNKDSYMRNLIQNGNITIYIVRSGQNLANLLTKRPARNKVKELTLG